MPKGAESKLAYKASVVGGELKVVFYGLVASGIVVSPEVAVKKLRQGTAFVYITCRNDVRQKFEDLWHPPDPSPSLSAQSATEGGSGHGKDGDDIA